MAQYSWLNADEARFTEEVSTAMQRYKEPIELKQFMLDNKQFEDGRSVRAALDLLAEDGRVTIYIQRK